MQSLIRRFTHHEKEDARTGSIRSQSTNHNTTRSNKIDALIAQDSKELWRKADVLVIGLPQSGKSTLLNRMRQFQEPSQYDKSVHSD